jgi:DNA-binding NarL/FixJ family response regulator
MCAVKHREPSANQVRIRKPSVLLADDHVLVAAAVKELLSDEFDVVGAVSDGRTLVDIAPELRPDIILLDLSMPLLSGMDAGERLKKLLPETKIVILTMTEDPETVAAALRSWASGFVLKNSGKEELISALQEALAGGVYVCSALRPKVRDLIAGGASRPQIRKLTPRQREVLQLLAEGLSMKQAAGVLHVSTRTIAFHKYNMMAALGLRTNSDLLRFAIRKGLLKLA